jgi:hypothetical protein
LSIFWWKPVIDSTNEQTLPYNFAVVAWKVLALGTSYQNPFLLGASLGVLNGEWSGTSGIFSFLH